MKPAPWILASLTGLVFGAGLVVACSDDSPGDADAAVCDCPAAEPPLQGRIMSVTGQSLIPAGGVGGQGAICPPGATILGGSCRLMNLDYQVVLVEAGIDRSAATAYTCRWSSTSATDTNVTVEAICLVPAT
jgi:hypothetical protein